MAKPFFTEKEKLSLLARIANGEDIEDVVELTGLTKEQIKKYT